MKAAIAMIAGIGFLFAAVAGWSMMGGGHHGGFGGSPGGHMMGDWYPGGSGYPAAESGSRSMRSPGGYDSPQRSLDREAARRIIRGYLERNGLGTAEISRLEEHGGYYLAEIDGSNAASHPRLLVDKVTGRIQPLDR